MKIKITRQRQTSEEVEVTLPHYYMHDVSGDSYNTVVYGKIDENVTTTITLTQRYSSQTCVAEIEHIKCAPQSRACYFKDEYKSTEAEYLDAKAQALEVLNGA